MALRLEKTARKGAGGECFPPPDTRQNAARRHVARSGRACHCRLAFYTAWPSQWGKEVIERLLLPGVQLRPCSESTLAAEEMEEVSNHVLLFDTPRGRPVTRERLTRRSGEIECFQRPFPEQSGKLPLLLRNKSSFACDLGVSGAGLNLGKILVVPGKMQLLRK
eukprot:2643584-Amphidinium_carterae.1